MIDYADQRGCKHPEQMVERHYEADGIDWECHACDDVLGFEPAAFFSPAEVARLRDEARAIDPDHPGNTKPGRLVELWEKEKATA